MKCPACGTLGEYEVLSTRSYGDQTTDSRRLWCACGWRWTTIETVKESSGMLVSRDGRPLPVAAPATRSALPVVGGNIPPLRVAGEARGQAIDPLPVAAGPPSNGANLRSSERGVGGGPSGFLFPVLADPDPVKRSDQEVDPARMKRRRGGPINYPPEFTRMWDAMETVDPKGTKSDALDRWLREGKPDPDLLVSKWNEYRESLGDQTAKHVPTWIGKRCWEDEYRPARIRGVSSKTAGNIDVLRNWSPPKEQTR